MSLFVNGKSPGHTILLIEDNPADVVLTQEALKILGIKTQLAVCASGEDALNYLVGRSQEAPVAILLDLHLPDMDGWEILDAIATNPEIPEVPVLLMSHVATPRDLSACQAGKALAFVEKSVDFDGFVRNIANYRAILSPS